MFRDVWNNPHSFFCTESSPKKSGLLSVGYWVGDRCSGTPGTPGTSGTYSPQHYLTTPRCGRAPIRPVFGANTVGKSVTRRKSPRQNSFHPQGKSQSIVHSRQVNKHLLTLLVHVLLLFSKDIFVKRWCILCKHS